MSNRMATRWSRCKACPGTSRGTAWGSGALTSLALELGTHGLPRYAEDLLVAVALGIDMAVGLIMCPPVHR